MNRFDLLAGTTWSSLKTASLDSALYALPAFEGLSILTLAAKQRDLETLDAILRFGGDPDTIDLTGHTPLMRAAIAGDLPICTRLLSAGAGINTPGLCGRTPLMAAAFEGHVDLVLHLLENGADPGAVDQDGNSAFDYGALAPRSKVSRLREIIPVAEHASGPPAGASFAAALSQTRLISSFSWLGECVVRMFLAISMSFISVMLIGLAVLVQLQGNPGRGALLIPMLAAAGLAAVYVRGQVAGALDGALIAAIDVQHDPSKPASRVYGMIARSWAARMGDMRGKAEQILRLASMVPILAAALIYAALIFNLWSDFGEGVVVAVVYATFALILVLPMTWLAVVVIARPRVQQLRRDFLKGMLEDQSQEFAAISRHIMEHQDSRTDLGPFALYLRSFGIDNRLKVEGDYLESMLALSVAGSSLLVCISRDSDYMGAVEIAPSDAEWKAYILELAKAAAQIIFVPDVTSGVVWEADMLRREGLLDKVAFLMLPTGLSETNLDLDRRWASMRGSTEFRDWEIPPYAGQGGTFTLTRDGKLATWGPLPTDLVRIGISRPLEQSLTRSFRNLP